MWIKLQLCIIQFLKNCTNTIQIKLITRTRLHRNVNLRHGIVDSYGSEAADDDIVLTAHWSVLMWKINFSDAALRLSNECFQNLCQYGYWYYIFAKWLTICPVCLFIQMYMKSSLIRQLLRRRCFMMQCQSAKMFYKRQWLSSCPSFLCQT